MKSYAQALGIKIYQQPESSSNIEGSKTPQAKLQLTYPKEKEKEIEALKVNEIEVLRGIINNLKQQVAQMKDLVVKICYTMIKDESIRKIFKASLQNIANTQIETQKTQIHNNESRKQNKEMMETSTKENRTRNEKRKSNKIETTKNLQTVSADSYTSEYTHSWTWGKVCKNRKLEMKQLHKKKE